MRSDFGMLIARAVFGAGIAAHGAQKAFGTFDGPGPEQAAGLMRALGFEEGERAAAAASYIELVSGGLIATGFLGPIGPALLISNMIVAMEAVHIDNGFFASENGIEVPLLYALGALMLAAGGYGDCSIDKLFGLSGFFKKRPWFYVSLLGAAAGSVWVLTQRIPPPHQDSQAQPASAPAEPDPTAV